MEGGTNDCSCIPFLIMHLQLLKINSTRFVVFDPKSIAVYIWIFDIRHLIKKSRDKLSSRMSH